MSAETRTSVTVTHVEIVNGVPYVEGTPFKVRMVAGMVVKANVSVEGVQEHYGLTPAQVHSALAYYYDHLAAFQLEDEEIKPLIEAARLETEQRLANMRAHSRE
jgi:uncharacterized protein (DUF433 family)